jgi:hypothetical protein
MYIPSGRPLTPRELKSWLREHASPRTYCPAGCDGHTLGTDPWIWVIAGTRAYVICATCASDYCHGRNVFSPEEFPEITVARQWTADGDALQLASGQDPVPTDDELLRREAAELLKRLNHCHCCGSTWETVIVEIAVRNSRFVLSICHSCLASGSDEPLDLGTCGVTRELADRLSGEYSESVQ